MTDHSLDAQALRLLERARSAAAERGENVVAGEHLLAAIFESSVPARRALEALGIAPDPLVAELLVQARPPKPRSPRADRTADEPVAAESVADTGDATAPPVAMPEPTSQTRRLLALATRLAPAESPLAGERELLLAAAQEPRGPFARALNAANVSTFALRQAVVRELDGEEAASLLVDPAARRRAQHPGEETTTSDATASEADAAGLDAAADERRAARKAAKQAARDARDAKAAPTVDRTEDEAVAATRPSKTGAKDGRREKPPREAAAERSNREPGVEGRRDKPERGGALDQGALERSAPLGKAPSIGRIKPERPGVSWRLLLLAAVPASIVLSLTHLTSDTVLFVVTCVAVLPLAGYMGEATEHLAARTNPTVGGLLNATFGNAAELIIAAVALRAGYVELVKASIIGSILGNLLLILGLSIVAGGLDRPRVRFNRTGAGMSAGMLALAVVGLVFPALLHSVRPDAAARLADELHLSEVVAGILVVTYAFSLLFTLKTHQRLLGGEPHPSDGPTWGMPKALGVLALATAFVAWESEILVHAVEAVTRTAGIPEVFLGLILVPLIGNASEHAAAIGVARKGQMDLAFQIALGSSTQVALLVAPLLVVLGLVFGQRMDLVFTTFEVAALGLSVLVASIVTLDGESHWFEGVQLLAVYLMVAAAAFFL